MTKAYIVARGVRVTYAFMSRTGIPATKDTSWHAPVFDKDAKLFLSKASAVTYRDRMNKALKSPKVGKDGTIMLNIAPYDDFYIFPVERA